MKLKTSMERTYPVKWVDESVGGRLILLMADARRLPAIAAEFDGLKWLERISKEQGDKRFDGYSRLAYIALAGEYVQIILEKEA